MKLVVGIGNIGEKYLGNRHNAGFMIIDELARQMANDQWSIVKKFQSLIIKQQSLILFSKPQTMMNSSGKAVKKLVDHYKVNSSKIWVIHDDLDLKLGRHKIVMGKGPREHKGLLSIYESLGTKEFWHVRVGIDNRVRSHQSGIMTRVSGEQYVLQDFTEEEKLVIGKVIDKIVKDLSSRITNH